MVTVTNKGKVTARKKGTATISLQVGKKKYRYALTILQPVKQVKLSNSYLTLEGKKDQKTLKAKVYPSSASNKKIIWQSTNPSVASVSSDGMITPVGDGYCYIKAIAADRKKVYTQCYIAVHDCTAPAVQTSKYYYELYLINGLGKDGWYAESERPIYIKTNNPNMESISWKNAYSIWGMSGDATNFSDVDYIQKENGGSIAKVEGGYLINCGFSNENKVLFEGCDGVGTMTITENSRVVASFSCNAKDYNTETDNFIDSVIKQVTNSNMTPFKKMDAVVNYIEAQNPRYYPNDGTYLYNLAASPLAPWFKSWRFDSLTTPTLLCRFANRMGGFDKIENGYSKYYGTSDWSWKHWYAELTVGDETRSFTLCPMSYTGYMETVPKIDFKNTANMVRIY